MAPLHVRTKTVTMCSANGTQKTCGDCTKIGDKTTTRETLYGRNEKKLNGAQGKIYMVVVGNIFVMCDLPRTGRVQGPTDWRTNESNIVFGKLIQPKL